MTDIPTTTPPAPLPQVPLGVALAIGMVPHGSEPVGQLEIGMAVMPRAVRVRLYRRPDTGVLTWLVRWSSNEGRPCVLDLDRHPATPQTVLDAIAAWCNA